MLTQKRLKELLHYDPLTGIFTRLTRQSSNTKVGDIVGYKDNIGYLSARMDDKLYFLHRIAWLYVKGYFPEYQIDHKNGIRDDNRFTNLRHVTNSCNMQNTKKYCTNKSGFPGVHWHKAASKWAARLTINYKESHLGCYEEVLDAALARLTAELWEKGWKCNSRGVLITKIKEAWPEFDDRCLS